MVLDQVIHSIFLDIVVVILLVASLMYAIKKLTPPFFILVSLKYALVLISLFPFNTSVNLLSVNNTNNNKS